MPRMLSLRAPGLRRSLLASWSSLLLVASFAALAGSPARADGVEARFHHDAPAEGVPGQPLELVVDPVAPDDVRRARVRFRRPGAGSFDKVDMRREGEDLLATIPGEKVGPPALEYYIVVQLVDGTVRVVFADPRFPHRVEVRGGDDDLPSGDDPPGDGRRGADPSAAGAESVASPTADGEDEFSPARGPGASGRRIPGAGRKEGGDPFLDELAVFGAEDPTSMGAIVVPERIVFAATSVLERDEIRRLGARTLLDALAAMPGISTSKDMLGFDRVALRGLRTDARIALIVDGQRVNNPYDGRALWKLPADLVERVELVRSPVVDAPGGPAMNGAILVTTRRAPGLSAHVWGGSFLTGGASVTGGTKLGELELFGGAQLQYTEGPTLPVERDSFSRSGFERPVDALRTHADELSGALSLGGSYRLPGAHVFGQALVQGEGRGPYVGAFDTVGESSRLTWMTWAASAGVEIPIGDLGSVTTRAFADQHYVDRTLQLSPKGFFTPDRDGDGELERFDDGVLAHLGYATVQVGAESELALRFFEGNTFRFGLGASFATLGGYSLEMNRGKGGAAQPLGPVDGLALGENGPCDFHGASLDGVGACRLTLSIHASDEWRVLPELAALAGLGVASFSDAAWSALSHVRPSLGLVYTPLTGLDLRVFGSGGVRPPTWEERYDQLALGYVDYSAGGYVGNPALVPESQLTLEVGADYRFSLAGIGYTLTGTGFASSVGGAIERIDLTGNVEQPTAGGGYDMVGAEAGARAELAGGSAAFVNVSWVRAWYRSPVDLDPDAPLCALYPWEAGGQPCTLITHVPQLRANVGLHLALGPLGRLSAWSELHAARQNNARSTLERLRPFRIPAFALLNLSYESPRLFDVVGIEARAFNLLDAAHPDDVPRPDRVTGLLPREGVSVYGGIVLDL